MIRGATRGLLGACGFASVVACSAPDRAASNAAVPPPKLDPPPPSSATSADIRDPAEHWIGTLRTRDVDLRITATGAGPRFAIERHDGSGRIEAMDAEQLRTEHPEVYRMYRAAYARAPRVDARLDWRFRQPLDRSRR
jgi:hypothetical protein